MTLLPRRASFVPPLGIAIALAACFPQFGSYDTTEGGGGSGGVAEGGAGGEPLPQLVACGASSEGVCFAPVAGWEGPFALSKEASGCKLPFPETRVEGFTDWNTAPAQCTCTCTSNQSCALPTLTQFLGPECTGNQVEAEHIIGASSCVTSTHIQGGEAISVRIAGSTALVQNTCEPGDSQFIVPPLDAEPRALCTGATPIADETCNCYELPGGELERLLCISAPGEDRACPVPYSQRTVLSDGDLEDTRACSNDCACESGDECAVSVTVFDTGNCNGALATASVGDCVNVPGGMGFESALASQEIVGGACAPTGGTPMGSVMPVNPVTVCCALL